MKCFKHLLLPLLLLSACSQSPIDEEFAPTTIEGEPIGFTVNQQAGRASFFQGEGHGVTWDGGELIGIRAYDIDSPSSNKQRGNYTVSEDGECTLNKHEGIQWQGSPLTITAYYPATDNATATNLFEIPMSDQQVQTAAGDHSHITNYMVMQAEPQNFTQNPDMVSLEFCNLCAIVELTVKGSASHTVRRVTLSTTSESDLSATQLKLDATQSLFDNKGNLKANAALTAYSTHEIDYGKKQVSVSLTTPAKLSTDDGIKLYLVVLPGTHANKEITVSVETVEGKIAEQKMGAIAFKMNKVYRPTITLEENDFKAKLASITHRFNGSGTTSYHAPTKFEEGAVIYLNRGYYLYNVPTMAEPCQVATINASVYPTTNEIEAEDDGLVYLLALGSAAVSTTMKDYGWEPVTPIKGSTKVDEFKEGQIYYNATEVTTGEVSGILTLYVRSMTMGEKFDLTNIVTSGFQGLRPVAKAIHNEYVGSENAAEIEIVGTDTSAPFWGSVNFEDGVTPIGTRTITNGHSKSLQLARIPGLFTCSDESPWQTLSAPNTSCPSVEIRAKTAGKVYIMANSDDTTINKNMADAGWSAETTLAGGNGNNRRASINYYDGSAYKYFGIWSKEVAQGDVIRLDDIKTTLGTIDFQGVRPVAKKITWPLAQIEVEKATDAEMTTFAVGNSLTTKTATTIAKSDKKSFPVGYQGMNIYAVNGNAASTTVKAKAKTAGIVYAICPAAYYPTSSDTSARDAMDAWKQVESFYSLDGTLYYITGKYVAKNEELQLTYGNTLTQYFDRITGSMGILMGNLTETTEPVSSEITVRGTLIDIRPLTHSTDAANTEFYPQNENYILPQAGQMGNFAEQLAAEGYSYAVSLQEKRGPESFTTSQAGTVYIGTYGLTPSGWTKAGTLNVIKNYSTITYTIYQRSCTANETVSIPSGGTSSTIVFGKKLRVETPSLNTVLNGGVVIAKILDGGFRKRHATNVNIHILPDGSYLTLVTNTLYLRSTAIYRSTDKGATWKLYSTPTSMNFTRLFEHNGALYIMGTESDGELIICKSTDNGKTWTVPDATTRYGYINLPDGEKGHQAPTTIAVWGGRIWRAMETNRTDQTDLSYEQHYPYVISAPVNADLLDPEQWKCSNIVETENFYINGHTIYELIEGNVIVGPDDKLYNLLRGSCNTSSSKACLARVISSNTMEATTSDFVNLPGGCKKFTVLYDEQSGLYWTLTNPSPDSEAYTYKHNGEYASGLKSGLIRNRVSLYSSPDLKNWTLRKENVLYNSDPFFHGFQYIDFKIDGDDIVFVSRTAVAEERGLPTRQHDANMMTFHRIKNFRD